MTRSTNNTVLRKILGNPKFAEYNPALIEEAYGVMLQLAPRLALIEAIAGHWVRTVMITTFVDVKMVQDLCDAELAYTEANQVGVVRAATAEAFHAGIQWHRAAQNAQADCTPEQAFERWWQGSDDDKEEA